MSARRATITATSGAAAIQHLRLVARDHPAARRALCARAQLGRLAAEALVEQHGAGRRRRAREARQPGVLLLARAALRDRAAPRDRRRARRRRCRVSPSQLLGHHQIRDEIGIALPAERLRDRAGDAERVKRVRRDSTGTARAVSASRAAARSSAPQTRGRARRASSAPRCDPDRPSGLPPSGAARGIPRPVAATAPESTRRSVPVTLRASSEAR